MENEIDIEAQYITYLERELMKLTAELLVSNAEIDILRQTVKHSHGGRN
jgi:hypothetical protein